MDSYTVADIRKVEHYCIAQLGIAEKELMQRAGQQAWQVLQEQWPSVKRITVMCGPGNNGGDGYVLARLALEQGYFVEVYPLTSKPPNSMVALNAYHAYQQAGGKFSQSIDSFKKAELIVDALFGIGLERPIEGQYAEAIEAANNSKVPILALDVPSGLNADTGACLGKTIIADVTATFIANKIGLTSAPKKVGKIVLCDLQLPTTILSDHGSGT